MPFFRALQLKGITRHAWSRVSIRRTLPPVQRASFPTPRSTLIARRSTLNGQCTMHIVRRSMQKCSAWNIRRSKGHYSKNDVRWNVKRYSYLMFEVRGFTRNDENSFLITYSGPLYKVSPSVNLPGFCVQWTMSNGQCNGLAGWGSNSTRLFAPCSTKFGGRCSLYKARGAMYNKTWNIIHISMGGAQRNVKCYSYFSVWQEKHWTHLNDCSSVHIFTLC